MRFSILVAIAGVTLLSACNEQNCSEQAAAEKFHEVNKRFAQYQQVVSLSRVELDSMVNEIFDLRDKLIAVDDGGRAEVCKEMDDLLARMK